MGNIFRKLRNASRKSAGTYFEGTWVEGAVTTAFTFYGSLQPLTGKDMLSLPEGRRDRETYLIYTDTELKSVDVNDQFNPDIVVLDGNDFEIIQVEPWQNGIYNHYKAIASKKQVS